MFFLSSSFVVFMLSLTNFLYVCFCSIKTKKGKKRLIERRDKSHLKSFPFLLASSFLQNNEISKLTFKINHLCFIFYFKIECAVIFLFTFFRFSFSLSLSFLLFFSLQYVDDRIIQNFNLFVNYVCHN